MSSKFAQHCVICKSQCNRMRKIFGAGLKFLTENAILKEKLELKSRYKIVCNGCSIKLKKIFNYQNKINKLEQKIATVMEDLKEKANSSWNMQHIEDSSDGGEDEFSSQKVQNDNSDRPLTKGESIDEYKGQNGKELTSDFTAEDIVMKIELPDLANEPHQQINDPDPNQVELKEDVVIKCEFEPEDVEIMSTQTQNFNLSSSPQVQNAGLTAPLPPRQVVKSKHLTNNYYPPSPKLSAFEQTMLKLKRSPPRIKEDKAFDARVICPQCKVFFDGQLSLERHFKYSPKHASNEAIKRCDTCAISFPSLTKRIDHDKLKHPEMFVKSFNSIAIELPSTIKCGACGAEFYSEDGYSNHLGGEVKCEGGLSCERCPEVFRTLGERREHVREAHE